MAEQTSHYGLIKPTYDEHADVEVLNENMDTIDEQIYAANTSVRAVNRGGTGAATETEARTNLGVDILMDKDTDAETITWLSGSTTYVSSSNRALVVCRRGKLGILRCSINLTSTSTGTTYVDIGTLDAKFAPTTTIFFNAPIRDHSDSAGISIKNDLSVQLRHSNTTAGFLQFIMVYPLSSTVW